MNTPQPRKRPLLIRLAALHRRIVALTTCVVLSATVASCAAEGPFNPDHLGPDQYTQVTSVCQTVLGLNPKEPLSGGQWLGNDRLDYFTSHYRGCITSLSDSLQSVADKQLTRQADADCRAKGYKSDSPDLALCVLQTVNKKSIAQPAALTAGTLTPISEQLTPASGSFFYASGRESRHREELACAALGMSPSQDSFHRCVKGLNDTFYAIDNPVN